MKTEITETEIVHYFDNDCKSQERWKKIKPMLAEKMTYAQIGKELGISRQRVHQIVKKMKGAE